MTKRRVVHVATRSRRLNDRRAGFCQFSEDGRSVAGCQNGRESPARADMVEGRGRGADMVDGWE